MTLCAQRIGRREDLFGRKIRKVPQPVYGREVRGPPVMCRQHSDGQGRSRPAQLECVEAAGGEPRRRVVQNAHALLPRLSRIRLVEAQNVFEVAPQLLVGLVLRQSGIDELAPLGMRAGCDAPVGPTLADDHAELFDARQHVLAGKAHVESTQGVRGDNAYERHSASARLRVREHAPAEPFGHEVERARISVLDAGAFDPWIEVVDIDELRAPVVGRRGDGSGQRFLTELGGDQHDSGRIGYSPREQRARRGELQRSPIRQAILYLAANTAE